jgi:hypothetical protein
MTSLATAALVLLTLIGSYVAFGGPLRQRLEERSAHVPAITPEVTPTATPEPYELQGVVEAVAPGSFQTRIARAFLQPGAEVALFSGKSGDSALSPTFVVVESGQLEITAGGPIEVSRAAGKATTPVAAGATVTLESGDSAVIAAGVAISLRNPGPDPVTAINADVAPVGSGQSQEGYRVEILAELYDAPIRAAATMRLRQATLAPGETLPMPARGVVQLAAADTNMGFMLHTNDGYRNIGSSPIDAYVLTIESQA